MSNLQLQTQTFVGLQQLTHLSAFCFWSDQRSGESLKRTAHISAQQSFLVFQLHFYIEQGSYSQYIILKKGNI